MDILSRTELKPLLNLLSGLPLGETNNSHHKEVPGVGEVLLSYRRATGGRVHYFSMDLRAPLQPNGGPDPQIQLVSATDSDVVYGKPVRVRSLSQQRRLHAAVLLDGIPEEDVVFQLLPAAS